MNNSNLNKKPNYLNAHHTPDGYELDEIQWDEIETGYPVDADLIPFESSTKTFRKELAGLPGLTEKKL